MIWGSTMMEENVSKSGRVHANRMNQDEMIRLIKDVDENPAKRNTTLWDFRKVLNLMKIKHSFYL